MNESNLVSPVNSVSPEFMSTNLYPQPTLVKELEKHIGQLCVIEPINSMQKHYTAFNCTDKESAVMELRQVVPTSTTIKFFQRINYRFVLLAVEIDHRNNLLLKCLGAEGEPIVYWALFHSRNMKLSAISA